MEIKLMNGDCLIKLKELEADSVDSIVTDPPYHLTSITKRFGKENSAPAQYGTDGVYQRASKGFMGKEWDGGDIAFRTEVWEECLRVLKPGGYLLAFGGTRTYHRMTVAIEDSGFEIRDCIFWCYGSGFPKSHNIALAIDKLEGKVEHRGKAMNMKGAGNRKDLQGKEARPESSELYGKPYNEPISENANNWNGYGTALKPAVEPVVMARKPFKGSVAENVLEWGTGAINIDGCRVGHNEPIKVMKPQKGGNKVFGQGGRYEETTELKAEGRWPANLILDEEAGRVLDEQSGEVGNGWNKNYGVVDYNGKQYDSSTNQCKFGGGYTGKNTYADKGGASRFFYCPKVSKGERNEGLEDGNTHPTVKPQALMSYLIKLVTPKGGTVLDPFMGSGSTGKAAVKDRYSFIGIEREEEYFQIAEGRINAEAGPVKILEEFFE
jgi:site-specific DNA-methyltransferase (adenine-specific)